VIRSLREIIYDWGRIRENATIKVLKPSTRKTPAFDLISKIYACE